MKLDRKDSFSAEYHKWVMLASPHICYLEENRVRKARFFMVDLLWKFLGSNKDNLFTFVMRRRILYNVDTQYYFGLNVGRTRKY